MRKFLSIFLILTMLLSFTACSQETIENTEPAPTTESTESTETTEIIIDEPVPTTEPSTEPETEPIVTEPPTFQLSMSFTGDMMLAAYEGHSYGCSFTYYADTQDPSYFLEKVRHVFEADDFTVGNLENVLTDRSLSKRDKGSGRAFWFKSPTNYTDILTCSSFEGVSLANNHTYDFKQAGYDDTIEAVKNAGLNYGSEEKIMYFEKEGFVIAIICNGLWYEEQADDIVDRIKEAEDNSHFQIVFYHGGTEKAHAPESWRVRASRKLVDNGADLVLGNHPHVLQPKETYNGVEIIYSMGNFCYGGHTAPENRTMIYQIHLTIDKKTLDVAEYISNIIPCYVYTGNRNNFQPAIIEDEEKAQIVLDFMEGLRELPY